MWPCSIDYQISKSMYDLCQISSCFQVESIIHQCESRCINQTQSHRGPLELLALVSLSFALWLCIQECQVGWSYTIVQIKVWHDINSQLTMCVQTADGPHLHMLYEFETFVVRSFLGVLQSPREELHTMNNDCHTIPTCPLHIDRVKQDAHFWRFQWQTV